jgi:hypothetical protein
MKVEKKESFYILGYLLAILFLFFPLKSGEFGLFFLHENPLQW